MGAVVGRFVLLARWLAGLDRNLSCLPRLRTTSSTREEHGPGQAEEGDTECVCCSCAVGECINLRAAVWWITQPPSTSRLFAKMDYKHGGGGNGASLWE